MAISIAQLGESSPITRIGPVGVRCARVLYQKQYWRVLLALLVVRGAYVGVCHSRGGMCEGFGKAFVEGNAMGVIKALSEKLPHCARRDVLVEIVSCGA